MQTPARISAFSCAKVAAIGIGIHNWVTFHGLALNVDPILAHFDLIVPCGLKDKPVTSLRQLVQRPPAMPKVMDDLERHFKAHFEDPISPRSVE